LAILAVASTDLIECPVAPVDIVRAVIDFFPGALAVADNDGNLPIHTAVSSVQSDEGASVVFLLLDEARSQVAKGLRFSSQRKQDDRDDTSIDSDEPGPLSDMAATHCNMVMNSYGDTPLFTAIHARAGWKIIESLMGEPGGSATVLQKDRQGNNALHLLVSEAYLDSASVMCLLKIAPEAACVRNGDGMLPIEIASLGMLPSEVVLALVLVDLPFEVDDVMCDSARDGFGASWFYLACECDDHYLTVVEEVLGLCSYAQVRRLCFYNEAFIARATPKCRELLQHALRFLGRFEFVGTEVPDGSSTQGYQLFAAIDYGEGSERRVLLKNYTSLDLFHAEVSSLIVIDLAGPRALTLSLLCRLP
jgi:hypothetical protein